jgi:hypothetical protein
VSVTSGGRTWTGGFALRGDETVLLVGLEANGFAAAGTRDLVLGGSPDAQVAPPGGMAGAPTGTVAGEASGGVAGGPPRPMNPGEGSPPRHGGPPEGTWIGLMGLIVAGSLLGWAARARG